MKGSLRAEREKLLKWDPEKGFALSNQALAFALNIEGVLEFYRSEKSEEVNTPRESYNWDLRIRKLRDIVCKQLRTAPSYLIKRDDDDRSLIARAAAIKCLRDVDEMSDKQIGLFGEECFGAMDKYYIRAELGRIATVIAPGSRHELARPARAAISEYARKLPRISALFENRLEYDRRLSEVERRNLVGQKTGDIKEYDDQGGYEEGCGVGCGIEVGADRLLPSLAAA